MPSKIYYYVIPIISTFSPRAINRGILNIFYGLPHLATCTFLFFYNEPELGVRIDPGMALTPLPSSIGRGLNPQPSDRGPSALSLDYGFRLYLSYFGHIRYVSM